MMYNHDASKGMYMLYVEELVLWRCGLKISPLRLPFGTLFHWIVQLKNESTCHIIEVMF